MEFWYFTHLQTYPNTWTNSASTPNRLLMSSSYIYITNIIMPNNNIPTCTNPPKTCSFHHDALPVSHLFWLFDVVWLLPQPSWWKEAYNHHGGSPWGFSPLAIRCWNDCGQLVLSPKSQCLRVGESVWSINLRVTNKKYLMNGGVKDLVGDYRGVYI